MNGLFALGTQVGSSSGAFAVHEGVLKLAIEVDDNIAAPLTVAGLFAVCTHQGGETRIVEVFASADDAANYASLLEKLALTAEQLSAVTLANGPEPAVEISRDTEAETLLKRLQRSVTPKQRIAIRATINPYKGWVRMGNVSAATGPGLNFPSDAAAKEWYQREITLRMTPADPPVEKGPSVRSRVL